MFVYGVKEIVAGCLLVVGILFMVFAVLQFYWVKWTRK